MDTTPIDESIKILVEHKDEWVKLPITEKIDLLGLVLANLKEHAQEWIDVSIPEKQIEAKSPWVGEEWASGIWALAAGLRGYQESLTALAKGQLPKLKKVWKNTCGNTVVQIYPNNFIESLLLSGVTAEVWMQQDVTKENIENHIALFYKQRNPVGKVTLVLGAGNVNSIPAYDALYMLIARGQVVLLKMNPVNDYLSPILNKIFKPFISAGYLQIVSGGVDVGNYLAHHPDIHDIHMTGSARTHDAIVFGIGDDGKKNKNRNEPILKKPITSELGSASPLIVLPGKWSKADIRFQAERVVTMKLHNSGFNCVASQVLILPQNWELQDNFLDAIRDVLRKLPARKPYYPGTEERKKAVMEAYPEAETFEGGVFPTLITNISSDAANEYCFNKELFCSILAQTTLPGDSASSYLKNVVAFCNEKLYGTLGASIIVHPRTKKELGKELDRAVADLHYGSIGINVWNALAFLLPQAPWGAYPGETLNNVQSGIGVVHSTFLLEKTEKTVVSGSFYNFPRGLLHFNFSLLPKPPWFVTNKTAHITNKRVALYTIDKNVLRVPGIFTSALRG